MPMINIAEAQGKVLDWLCAIALRLDLYGPADFLEQRNHHVKHGEYVYRWSSSHAQAGELMDSARISTIYTNASTKHPWWACVGPCDDDTIGYSGATRLEAGIRCFVIHALGEEYEVPQELLS